MRSAEENNLEKDLKRWFSKLQKRVQKLIDTYYEDELFFLHVNKVYTIVEDMKPEYNAILLKHGLNVFYNAREVATTLYTIQQKKVSSKASLYEPKIIRPEDMGLFRTNPQIEDSLRYNTFVASDTTLARVTNNITNNLADSYHEGIGIKDAGRRINKEFTSLKGWESKRIARTEINSAQNVGSFSTYDELGVEYHMWWTGLDERVRDSHEDLHGHIVAVGNTFKNGLLHPGDKAGKPKEYMNCRCTSIPYIIPLGMMAPLGMSEFTEADLIPIPGYTPITVEDALNGEYPLDYYIEGGVMDQHIRNRFFKKKKSGLSELFSSDSESKSKSVDDDIKTETRNAEELFKEKGISKEWNKNLNVNWKRLKNKFRGVIPEQELDDVFNHFLYFVRSVENWEVENCTIRTADGKIVPTRSDNETSTVDIPEDIRKEGNENYIDTVIHNHPRGSSPFASPKDIREIVKCGIKTHKSTNEFGTMTIRNKDYQVNKTELKEICKIATGIYKGIIKDFEIDVNNGEPVNPKDPNDAIRLNNYVNEHYEKYSKQYEERFNDYFEVNFIKHDFQIYY